MKSPKYAIVLKLLQPHLPQKVILSHHVPVPHLHSDCSLPTQLLWIQFQLQSLTPVRETGFLDNLKPRIWDGKKST